MGYLDTEGKVPRGRFEWKPWLLWVAATGFGYISGSYLVGWVSLLSAAPGDITSVWVWLILSVLVTGAIMGLAQGMVFWMYMHVPIVRPWVLATMIGIVLGVGVIFLSIFVRLPFMSCVPLPFIIPAALLGASVGYAQRRVIKLYLDAYTRWVWINVLAAILSLLLVYAGIMWGIASVWNNRSLGASSAPLGSNSESIWLISLLGTWLPPFVYGAVTGSEFLRIVQLYREQR